MLNAKYRVLCKADFSKCWIISDENDAGIHLGFSFHLTAMAGAGQCELGWVPSSSCAFWWCGSMDIFLTLFLKYYFLKIVIGIKYIILLCITHMVSLFPAEILQRFFLCYLSSNVNRLFCLDLLLDHFPEINSCPIWFSLHFMLYWHQPFCWSCLLCGLTHMR